MIRRVYIAGPYSSDPEAGTKAALDAAERVRKAGYVPFIPHLSHYWHQHHEHTYREWLAWGMAWVTVCDAVLRLPGDSPGADKEVSLAHRFHIPIAYDLEQLKRICPIPP